MRQRLSQDARRTDILTQALRLFRTKGYAATEMEDIRLACGISRGGLYHHFGGKAAILSALVASETSQLAQILEGPGGDPIAALLTAGSAHLGADPGVLSTLTSDEDRLTYLGFLDRAIASELRPVLERRLANAVTPDVQPSHVAELFLSVNSLINRRTVLNEWSGAEAASFAGTALGLLAPCMQDPAGLRGLARQLAAQGGLA